MEFFDDEFDYRETTNWEELTNLAVALFIGMAGGPAVAPSGGGGGSPIDNNWGREKDEDDHRWAWNYQGRRFSVICCPPTRIW